MEKRGIKQGVYCFAVTVSYSLKKQTLVRTKLAKLDAVPKFLARFEKVFALFDIPKNKRPSLQIRPGL